MGLAAAGTHERSGAMSVASMTHDPSRHPPPAHMKQPPLRSRRAGRLFRGAVALIAIGVVYLTVVRGDGSAPTSPARTTSTVSPVKPALSVDGARLIGPDGAPMRLIGVNRAGAEYACVQNFGIWDGASDAAFVDVMRSWGINSVRIPLNEHCWLGINEAPAEYSGQVYRDAIAEFVSLLKEKGLIAVLDLQWSGPGDALAEENMPMPNADHSADFWRSAATLFKDAPNVLFDVFNEPHDVDWECWRDGGCTMPQGYVAVGMQELIDAVRSTGATQPIIVSGVRYANDLTRWLELAPTDPASALIAGFHLYNFNQCATIECWSATVAPVALDVPVIASELGENTCSSEFITGFMDWADAQGLSYLAWTFNTWECKQGPGLIVDEDGTPTDFGRGFRDHVLELALPTVRL